MLKRMSTEDARWAAVMARDKTQDGRFYYSVRTTGVYCRPSCGARRPLRENVAFFDAPAAAEAAGFRACKRCKPRGPARDTRDAALIADACRAIEAAESAPKLAELADGASLSPHHFHRLFKAVTGLTPHAYAAAHRAARMRKALGGAGTVTEAIYDAGFNSSSRFYEKSNEVLGMTPTRFRSGGAQEIIRYALRACPLGTVLVAATDKGVCAILMGDDKTALVEELKWRFPRAELVGADQSFEATVAEVVRLVEEPARGLDLPLDIRGTAFQQRVWKALREIPAGKTVSYTDVAKRIGAPRAVRAVAGACAANPLGIIVPCHRVLRSDGALSGYRWGIERKRALLKREGKA